MSDSTTNNTTNVTGYGSVMNIATAHPVHKMNEIQRQVAIDLHRLGLRIRLYRPLSFTPTIPTYYYYPA